jgi:nucleotide-binding universal stress UspA family protein
MYDRILVPTDGSDVARTAAEAAIALADRFDAELHVLHVLEFGDLPPGIQDAGADEFARRGEQATTTVAGMAADAGVDATRVVVDAGDTVHQAILAYAADNDVDCIVMGTYGRTGLDRWVLGSVAERTLRESSVPVLSVHEDTVFRPEFASLLVPTDGSDCSTAAADHAIELASRTGAALHVVNVVNVGAVSPDVDVGTLLSLLEEAGKRALDRVVGRAEDAGVSTVEASVLSGTPHRAIVDYAAEHDVDCIVMGTHGRTGLDRYLLGSVTERVARFSEVPVLALKPDETAD